MQRDLDEVQKACEGSVVVQKACEGLGVVQSLEDFDYGEDDTKQQAAVSWNVSVCKGDTGYYGVRTCQ